MLQTTSHHNKKLRHAFDLHVTLKQWRLYGGTDGSMPPPELRWALGLLYFSRIKVHFAFRMFKF